MLARLSLGFSHLCDRKLKHGLKDILNPLCSCSIEVETTTQYFRDEYWSKLSQFSIPSP